MLTLSANWDNSDKYIRVRCTSGPVTFDVIEDKGSAGAFWSELGRVLAQDEVHAEARAHQAYNRYREHAGGKSVHGDDLPIWEDADPVVQSHWIAAVGG